MAEVRSYDMPRDSELRLRLHQLAAAAIDRDKARALVAAGRIGELLERSTAAAESQSTASAESEEEAEARKTLEVFYRARGAGGRTPRGSGT